MADNKHNLNLKTQRESINDVDVSKKPFNKKLWRQQKYSVKSKVKQWENKKKVNALRKFNKELKKDGVTYDKKQRQNVTGRAPNHFQKAQMEYHRIEEEKQRKREEKKARQKERDDALAAYKQKKIMKFKKLSQKTRKGQPVMRGRMELLLEKIQREYGKGT